jgi:hypothetical protein
MCLPSLCSTDIFIILSDILLGKGIQTLAKLRNYYPENFSMTGASFYSQQL